MKIRLGPSCEALVVVLTLTCLGCSAKLSNPVEIQRSVPYAIVKNRVVDGRDANGGPLVCESSKILEFKNLPAGEPYGLNVDTGWFGWFAKNEFAVELFESGGLKSVTLNSDPQADELVDETATLLKEMAGAVKTVAIPSLSAGACTPTTTEGIECVVPLTCYQAIGGCPTAAKPCPPFKP